jgi:hypothetical protein
MSSLISSGKIFNKLKLILKALKSLLRFTISNFIFLPSKTIFRNKTFAKKREVVTEEVAFKYKSTSYKVTIIQSRDHAHNFVYCRNLDQFLSLEERLEMFHLPESHHQENGRLRQRPVKDSLVCALARLSEAFFAITLIILLFGDLFHLIQQLTNSKLKLGEFFLLCHVRIIDCMLAYLNVKMDTKL